MHTPHGGTYGYPYGERRVDLKGLDAEELAQKPALVAFLQRTARIALARTNGVMLSSTGFISTTFGSCRASMERLTKPVTRFFPAVVVIRPAIWE